MCLLGWVKVRGQGEGQKDMTKKIALFFVSGAYEWLALLKVRGQDEGHLHPDL
jgi:hypothetical protein